MEEPTNPQTPEQRTNAAIKVLSDKDIVAGYYDTLKRESETGGRLLATLTREGLDSYIGDDHVLRRLVDATFDLDPKVLGIACDIEDPILEEPNEQEFVLIEGKYIGPDGKERVQSPKYVPRHVFNAYDAMRKDYAEWLASQPREGLPPRPGLLLKSGYRSPAYQAVLALRTIHENGLEATLRSLLPPGYSQHGRITECAVDILMLGNDFGKPQREDGSLMEIDETIEGAWILQNAANYGFWMPFYPDPDNPTSDRSKTGIIIEPWHLQYVGAERAAILMSEHRVQEVFAARHAALGVTPPAIAA